MKAMVKLGDPSTIQNTKDRKLQEFENMLLRKLFGPKTGHRQKFPDFYTSPFIVIVVKPRGIPQAEYVARTEYARNEYRIIVGKSLGKW
jgi:hypothetical protein